MQASAEIAALAAAVFLGGVVSGFSSFAFSAAAGAYGWRGCPNEKAPFPVCDSANVSAARS